jgi:hypothetical protein
METGDDAERHAEEVDDLPARRQQVKNKVSFVEEPAIESQDSKDSKESLEDKFVETVEDAYNQDKTIRRIGEKFRMKSFENLDARQEEENKEVDQEAEAPIEKP